MTQKNNHKNFSDRKDNNESDWKLFTIEEEPDMSRRGFFEGSVDVLDDSSNIGGRNFDNRKSIVSRLSVLNSSPKKKLVNGTESVVDRRGAY